MWLVHVLEPACAPTHTQVARLEAALKSEKQASSAAAAAVPVGGGAGEVAKLNQMIESLTYVPPRQSIRGWTDWWVGARLH